MNQKFDAYYQTVEKAIQTLGVNPENARGEEKGQWLLYNGQTEVFVDLWEQQQVNHWNYFQPDGYALIVFQVVAPICYLPQLDKRLEFYEDLLLNNFNMFYASFTINTEEQMLVSKFRRVANELKMEDVIEAIESTGYYAELCKPILTEKYGTIPVNAEND
jgi:hypothetical protein